MHLGKSKSTRIHASTAGAKCKLVFMAPSKDARPKALVASGLVSCARTLTIDAQQLASCVLFDVHVRTTGDIHIDDHDTIEDVALAIGTVSICSCSDFHSMVSSISLNHILYLGISGLFTCGTRLALGFLSTSLTHLCSPYYSFLAIIPLRN